MMIMIICCTRNRKEIKNNICMRESEKLWHSKNIASINLIFVRKWKRSPSHDFSGGSLRAYSQYTRSAGGQFACRWFGTCSEEWQRNCWIIICDKTVKRIVVTCLRHYPSIYLKRPNIRKSSVRIFEPETSLFYHDACWFLVTYVTGLEVNLC
jgi:hypothetical protein